jgi:2-haloacid dehalogenase
MKVDAVLFDVGKVLLDWDPRYLYLDSFAGDAEATERFLAEVLTLDWISEMDAGKPMAQAVAERSAAYPQHAARIAMYHAHWEKTVRGTVPGSVEILAELRARDTRLCALTNFSTETWPLALRRFDFLGWFETAVVSGEVGLVKPDPQIYRLAIERCRLVPQQTLFIDDRLDNVVAARSCELHALQFTDAAKLRTDLAGLGLL